ncbi:nuclear transport factor 2 family protein [Bradyrhizobium sp. CW12]|nr:nuclear transport factor 2 family protein [Bradyrhizobium sp. CW12]MCK1646824.1 nuclear transport factor 2 family protein [Bradyrhizobium sp. 154]
MEAFVLEAVEADRRRLAACLAGDTSELRKLMAPGGVYIHTAGNIDTRDEFIEKVRTRQLVYRRIENKTDLITSGYGVVLICGTLDMDVVRSGTLASIFIRYCCTWATTAAEPQMLSWQSTPLACSLS